MKTPSFTSCRLSSNVWQQRIWITRPSSSSAAFVWAHPQKRSQSYSVGQMFECTKKRHLCVKRRRHSGSNCFPLLLKCQTFRPPSHRSTRMEPKGRNSEWGGWGGWTGTCTDGPSMLQFAGFSCSFPDWHLQSQLRDWIATLQATASMEVEGPVPTSASHSPPPSS